MAALKEEELKCIVSDRGWNNGLILSCESYRATLVVSQNSNSRKQNRSTLKEKQHILLCTATRVVLGRMNQQLKTSQRSLALYYRKKAICFMYRITQLFTKAACNETDSDKFNIDG